MRVIFVLFLAFTILLSCSDKKDNEHSNTLELPDIAKFALNKPVKTVIDSLELKTKELTFINEPPGILNSISVTFENTGTIEFFFEGVSIISDTMPTKDYYLRKVAQKTINEVKWTNVDGKKGSIKNIIIY